MSGADDLPVRSLWTCVCSGAQIIVTRASEDWIDYLAVGGIGAGGMKVTLLRELYVMAGTGCRIEARALGGRWQPRQPSSAAAPHPRCGNAPEDPCGYPECCCVIVA